MIQKKLLAALTAMTLSVLHLPHVSASAETWTPLTDTIEWQLADGTLTIRGTGEMPDFFCSAHRIRSADREFIPYDTDQLALWYNAAEDDLVSVDLSGDGVIDAQDAAMILSYAAYSATGLEGGLMLYQHRFANGLVLAAEQTGDGAAAADLTGDAEVDAMDAVLVLQYAAAVGAGYDQGLQAFLN